MISQNKTLTKGEASIGGTPQSCKYLANRTSTTTSGSSFSGPLVEALDRGRTVAPANAVASITAGTRMDKEVKMRAIHKHDARLVIASRNVSTSDVLVYGDVTITFSAMEVHRRGQLVALTCKEFRTLVYLLRNARRVISRDELLNEVWGYESYPCTRTVDNHILRLRKKLELEPDRPKHLRTVRGMGYKFLP
jgi:DNA-binding response OmpR family regulator